MGLMTSINVEPDTTPQQHFLNTGYHIIPNNFSRACPRYLHGTRRVSYVMDRIRTSKTRAGFYVWCAPPRSGKTLGTMEAINLLMSTNEIRGYRYLDMKNMGDMTPLEYVYSSIPNNIKEPGRNFLSPESLHGQQDHYVLVLDNLDVIEYDHAIDLSDMLLSVGHDSRLDMRFLSIIGLCNNINTTNRMLEANHGKKVYPIFWGHNPNDWDKNFLEDSEIQQILDMCSFDDKKAMIPALKGLKTIGHVENFIEDVHLNPDNVCSISATYEKLAKYDNDVWDTYHRGVYSRIAQVKRVLELQK